MTRREDVPDRKSYILAPGDFTVGGGVVSTPGKKNKKRDFAPPGAIQNSTDIGRDEDEPSPEFDG